MSVFGRLANLWKGFISLWISDVEKDHPEIAYENAINSMVEKYSALKRATAAIIRRREELAERLTSQQKELAQVTSDLNTAIETNQDDLSVVLIQKKNQLESAIAELQADSDLAAKDADSAKQSLLSVQNEIKKLKAEKETMVAKLESAQARMRIQEQLEGLSVDAEVQALDNVRTHIKTQVAQANLNKELGETDLDARLKTLRNASGDVTAKQQLSELKAAAAAKRAADEAARREAFEQLGVGTRLHRRRARQDPQVLPARLTDRDQAIVGVEVEHPVVAPYDRQEGQPGRREAHLQPR